MRALFKKRLRPVLQMEAAECGAASLAMVLSAHGREISLEEARDRCATSRDGVDAAALVHAGESYGLVVKAVRREPETLSKLPLPAILHWSFNHFVVLEKVSGGRFTLLDPALGRRVVDAKEMDRCFTGLALAAAPGEDFKRGGWAPSATRGLLEHARGSWDGLGLVLALGVLAAAPGLALSGAVSTFADHVIGEGRFDWMAWLFAGVAAAAALQALLAVMREWTVAAIKSKISVVLAAQAFHRALRLPLRFFAQRNASEIVSRLRIGSELGGAVAGPLAQIAPNAVTAVIYLAVVALYDPVIGLVIAGVSALNLIGLLAIARRVAEANRVHHLKEGLAGGVATSGFASLDAFRLHGRQSLLSQRWLAAEEAALQTEQKLGAAHAISQLGPVAAVLLTTIAVVCVGALRVMEGDLSLGALLALQVLAGLVCSPVSQIAGDISHLQEAAGPLMRLQDLSRHPHDPMMADDATPAPALIRPVGRLQLEGLGFGYSAHAPLFQDVTLTFEPGQMTALTGPSGAGKSTFAKIAAGLMAPSAGAVRLDGAALADWPRDLLRSKLRYAPQTAGVFSGTMAENLSLWNPAIDDRQMVEAMRLARCEHLLDRGGLKHRLSSEAPGFSGGEIQRLALARVLVGEPQVVVLDEATSALDGLCESEVIEALRATGAAVLIVTHSAAVSQACDRMLELTGRGQVTLRAAAEPRWDAAPEQVAQELERSSA